MSDRAAVQAELDAKIQELEQFQGLMMAQLMSSPTPEGAAAGAAKLELLMGQLEEIKSRCTAMHCPVAHYWLSPAAAAAHPLLVLPS